MRRRAFITLLGGAAAGLPLTTRAQQAERVRRIGVLLRLAASDPQGQAAMATFRQAMQQLGWRDGQNVTIDVRWSEYDVEGDRRYAAELVALTPDVILASGTLSVAALKRATHTLPIVFVRVTDPVAAGLVTALARPGGNITGFMNSEYSLSGKWLELLIQIAPAVTRAAVLKDPNNPAGSGDFGVIQAAAQPRGLEVTPINVDDPRELESSIAAFARSANGGLIVTPSASISIHRDLIVTLAARHKLPAVYGNRANVGAGGLISYGAAFSDQFRRAAGYVDRILKGEKPGDLPVQTPTKFELVINLKTAKSLGLAVPPALLAQADEVIE